MSDFGSRYGPWAIIAGASEGVGAAFARQLATKGIACILIARREAPLTALATDIRATNNVECITATIDLAAPDAFERLLAVAGDREIGLFVSNAGADPNGARFLDRDIAVWQELVQRNVQTMISCCHHFGGAMRRRGRGGLLLVNSGAAYNGGDRLAIYSATKAFTLCFGESLWAELQPHGVDVLNLMMTITDTPPLRTLLAERGLDIPHLASPDAVAADGLARLSQGPVYNWGEDEGILFSSTTSAQRRKSVLATSEGAKMVFGD